MNENEIICFFDGACVPRNSGGYMGWGSIIKHNGCCKQFFDGAKEHPDNTNNVAEYLAFIKLMQELQGEKNKTITIYGDSKLVVMQMNNLWRIKFGKYKMLAVSAKKFITELKKYNKVIVNWIPRELNTDADNLSNEGVFKVAGQYIQFIPPFY